VAVFGGYDLLHAGWIFDDPRAACTTYEISWILIAIKKHGNYKRK
jgi:hypothetical protein